jgi:hypothetical protein
MTSVSPWRVSDAMQIQDVEVLHFIPGRVRLRVSRLKQEGEIAQQVHNAFSRVPGITGVDINPVTGSVLLHYDTKAVTTPESARVLSETLRVLFPRLDVDRILRWIGAPTGG